VSFREKVIELFEKENDSKILELCTSDTHVTAAKTLDAKGYLALGDAVSPEKIASALGELYKIAKSRLGQGNFSSLVVRSRVKTIGSEVLTNFSGLLDAASSVAKNGARILALVAIVLTATVALL
jgi:predicted neutral ceramidase superfamily lipid hydrolase